MAPGGQLGGEPPPRFVIGPDDIRRGTLRLSGDEGHHARNVLRLRPGDALVAIDGRGAEYEAVVQVQTADGVLARVVKTTRRTREPVLTLTLAQAVLKPTYLPAVVAYATALGAAEVVLFPAARSVPREVDEQERRHLNAVAAAAAKQSLRAVIPAVKGPVAFREMVKLGNAADRALVCAAELTPEPLARLMAERPPQANRFLVAIGPEGGFDERELAELTAAGFRPLGLGPRRLRAELAAATACALVLYAGGDLGPGTAS